MLYALRSVVKPHCDKGYQGMILTSKQSDQQIPDVRKCLGSRGILLEGGFESLLSLVHQGRCHSDPSPEVLRLLDGVQKREGGYLSLANLFVSSSLLICLTCTSTKS